MPLRNKWCPFKAEVISSTPEKPGAYELGCNDTVVYIGSSDNSIRSRIREHKKRAHFMKVTHFRYKKVEWREEARELEAKLCITFKRTHNGKPPRLQERSPKKKPSLWD